ncbi:MAG: hypothetical protein KAW49_12965 [Anaerolineae bacterium]|nr:hypothetical protein [Anaerolineae bacterium]MCK4472683.1 hypothetical protein [Anaerolineae bacterium]
MTTTITTDRKKTTCITITVAARRSGLTSRTVRRYLLSLASCPLLMYNPR